MTYSKKMHNPTSYFKKGLNIHTKIKLNELQRFIFYQTSTKMAELQLSEINKDSLVLSRFPPAVLDRHVIVRIMALTSVASD